jgi:endonuclease/exonuclease/phosphatase family metal-dependent hydrolase
MRVVSYNIQYGTGKDGQVDLERIAGDIGDADIIALQEVERYFSTTGNIDQPAGLAALFPTHFWVYGAGVDLHAGTDEDKSRRRQFGNMLLSRWPVLSSRNHLLPKTGYVDYLALQRSALEAVIETPLGGLRVYSVHLGHVGGPERRRQITALMEIVNEAPADGGVVSGRQASKHWTTDAALPPMPSPAMLLGDFNLAPETAEYELLVGKRNDKYQRLTTHRHLVDAWVTAGDDVDAGDTCFDHFGRSQRIDYAFVTPDLADRVQAISVDTEAQGSDHQPLILQLE